MLKVLVAAALGFGLPPAILFGGAALLTDPTANGGIRGGVIGQVTWVALLLAAPFVGYLFIARPFGHWRDFDRGTLLFAIGLSALYWTIYTPLLLYWLMMIAVGWSGGI